MSTKKGMIPSLKLRARLSLTMVGITSLAVLACGILLLKMATTSIDAEVRARAQATAAHYGETVANRFSAAMAAAREAAAAFEGLVDSGVADRDTYNAILRKVLEQNPLLVGVWTGWEADALDGRDAEFAGTSGHDATGRFIPYWVRTANGIEVMPLEGYAEPGTGDYYLVPQKTGKATVLDPFVYQVSGKDILMTTLAFPIRKDGKVLGVVGVDIALDGLQEQLSSIKPFGTGYLTVVSDTGIMVSHPKTALLGKNVRELGIADGLVAGLTGGEKKTISGIQAADGGQTSLVAIQPFEFSGVSRPWTAAVVAPEDQVFEALTEMQWLVFVLLAVAVVVTGFIALFVGGNLAKPIVAMTRTMTRLAEGDTGAEVPSRERTDEIGEMAGAVQVFKDNAIEKIRLEQEREEQQRKAEAEKKAAMNHLADTFEASVGRVVGQVSSASTEMQASSESMSATAEETTRQSAAVAAASEQASANVQTVASAAEELSSSIAEISRQVGQASEIAASAVREAEQTNTKIQGLAEAANKIGEVVALITDIADQTNLLALNATIEAARAGDAGKGFAVVASEVKNLANQTAKATDEIGTQISGIQTATREAVAAIEVITKTISRINEVNSGVASAVEEQGAATQEIARNVEQAAAGTQEVSSNISGVSQAANDTGAAAEQIRSAAGELSQQSETLRSEVEKFLANVRTA